MKKPTAAFVGASWIALTVFLVTYLVALWRMGVPSVEVYFFVSVMLFGAFGVVAIVKSIRDREEGVPVTGFFLGLSWVATLAPLALIGGYLLNESTLDELQRGLLFLTYVATIFAVVVVQKNVRDTAEWRTQSLTAVDSSRGVEA